MAEAVRHYDLSGKFIPPTSLDPAEVESRADAGDNSARYLSALLHLHCYNQDILFDVPHALKRLRDGAADGDALCALSYANKLSSGAASFGTRDQDAELSDKYFNAYFGDILKIANNGSVYAKTLICDCFSNDHIEKTRPQKSANDVGALVEALNALPGDVKRGSRTARSLDMNLALYMEKIPRKWDNRSAGALLSKLARDHGPTAQAIKELAGSYVATKQTEKADNNRKKEVIENLREASGMGDPEADFLLYHNLSIKGLNYKPSEAFQFLMKSATAGLSYAMAQAAIEMANPEMLPRFEKWAAEEGIFVFSTDEEGKTSFIPEKLQFLWFSAAALHEIPQGLYGLAKIEENAKNYDEALSHHLIAANNYHPYSAFEAAKFYFEGRGESVPRDPALAFYLYDVYLSLPIHFYLHKPDPHSQNLAQNRWKELLSNSWAEDADHPALQMGVCIIFPDNTDSDGRTTAKALRVSREEYERINSRLVQLALPKLGPA